MRVDCDADTIVTWRTIIVHPSTWEFVIDVDGVIELTIDAPSIQLRPAINTSLNVVIFQIRHECELRTLG